MALLGLIDEAKLDGSSMPRLPEWLAMYRSLKKEIQEWSHG